MSNGSSYLRDRRIITLLIVFIALAALDAVYGLHFGIEFIGGTQIPVALEHPVNVSAESTLIAALQQRLSTFGLQQVTVEGIGNSELYIVLPTTSATSINQTLNIIESQGRFDGIVDGRQALNGSSILKGSIGSPPPEVSNNTVGWIVNFYVTQTAAVRFSKVVYGQALQPMYLFLDRPLNTAIVIDETWLANVSSGLGTSQAQSDMQSALSYGNQTIPVLVDYGTPQSENSIVTYLKTNKALYTTVLASDTMNQSTVAYLKSMNYTVKLESRANMTPAYVPSSTNGTIIDYWPLVGLLSAPVLEAGITNGSVSTSYQISGTAPLTIPPGERYAYAFNQTKTLSSILSGGALPVAVIPGTPTTIPPTLGKKFLYVSALAALIAVIFVSAFIVVRYRKMFLVVPILLTTLMELFIIVSILGLVGTIDLAAVAGIIAVIGTGVDAQVIITDEIVARKTENSAKMLLNNAFYIVWADVALLVTAMLPLFFSTSLVSVIGFAEATIIGALLSVLITRPAYGAILSKRYAS